MHLAEIALKIAGFRRTMGGQFSFRGTVSKCPFIGQYFTEPVLEAALA